MWHNKEEKKPGKRSWNIEDKSRAKQKRILEMELQNKQKNTNKTKQINKPKIQIFNLKGDLSA